LSLILSDGLVGWRRSLDGELTGNPKAVAVCHLVPFMSPFYLESGGIYGSLNGCCCSSQLNKAKVWSQKCQAPYWCFPTNDRSLALLP